MHHARLRLINNAHNTHAQSLENFPCQCKICRHECPYSIQILITPASIDSTSNSSPSSSLHTSAILSYLPYLPPYSTFNPTFPNPLIPPAQIIPLTTHAAKQVQKLALYPSHKASIPPCALAPSAAVFAAVTLAATIDVIAKPTELPIWAIVLKTPPAKACVRTGNRDVIAKFEIVYNTMISICKKIGATGMFAWMWRMRKPMERKKGKDKRGKGN